VVSLSNLTASSQELSREEQSGEKFRFEIRLQTLEADAALRSIGGAASVDMEASASESGESGLKIAGG
jgi:hypothetical protein